MSLFFFGGGGGSTNLPELSDVEAWSVSMDGPDEVVGMDESVSMEVDDISSSVIPSLYD